MQKLPKDKIRNPSDHYPDRYFCIHWQDTGGLCDLYTLKKKKNTRNTLQKHMRFSGP